MSFREPSRGEKRQVGRRADGGENEGLPVAEGGPRRAIRIHGMDARQSPAPLTLYRFARRQEAKGRGAGRIESFVPKKRSLVDRINSLPKWARDYITYIETEADPAGTQRRLIEQQDLIRERKSRQTK